MEHQGRRKQRRAFGLAIDICNPSVLRFRSNRLNVLDASASAVGNQRDYAFFHVHGCQRLSPGTAEIEWAIAHLRSMKISVYTPNDFVKSTALAGCIQISGRICSAERSSGSAGRRKRAEGAPAFAEDFPRPFSRRAASQPASSLAGAGRPNRPSENEVCLSLTGVPFRRDDPRGVRCPKPECTALAHRMILFAVVGVFPYGVTPKRLSSSTTALL